MADVFSPELLQLVQQELATGRYKSEEEVLLEAMRLLRERDANLKRFRANLRARLDRLDAGDGVDLDDGSLAAFLDEIEAEVGTEETEKRE